MRPLSTCCLAVSAALFLATPVMGCDRSDDDRSPPVTVAGAPAPQEAPAAPEVPEPPADDGDGDLHSPELPEGTDDQQSKFMRARTAFLQDDYDTAEELFRELAFDEPITGDTISSAIALGQIYLETGRSEQAMELFEELQEHVQEIPEVLLVLARTYVDLDYPGLALDAYDRAYELQPDYIFILPDMARILIQHDQEERAVELLQRYEDRLERMATKLESPDETGEPMRLYVVDILGLLHDERAHQALEFALANDPNERIRTLAAQSLGELGVFEARDGLQHAAVNDPDETVRSTARHALSTLRDFEQQMQAPQ